MEAKKTIVQKLEVVKASQIVNLPEVQKRFEDLYVTFNNRDSHRYFESEKFHFAKLMNDNASLAACTKLSLYGCLLDMAVMGLSFDPNLKQAYLVPKSFNTGSKQNPIWEKRAILQISGYGELTLRVQQGQIKYADNPVLVYEGDKFILGTEKGSYFITHEAVLPRKEEASIIACYLRITRSDDSIDYKVLTMPEIEKLRSMSDAPNSTAWTKGLPGMVQIKTIKHAFRTYPKLKFMSLTKNTQLISDAIDENADVVVHDIYQIDESPTASITQDSQEEFDVVPEKNTNGIYHDDENF